MIIRSWIIAVILKNVILRPDQVALQGGGLSLPEVGRRLSIPESTSTRWVKTAKDCGSSDNGRKHKSATNDQMELARFMSEKHVA